jgi:hypothetical protein
LPTYAVPTSTRATCFQGARALSGVAVIAIVCNGESVSGASGTLCSFSGTQLGICNLRVLLWLPQWFFNPLRESQLGTLWTEKHVELFARCMNPEESWSEYEEEKAEEEEPGTSITSVCVYYTTEDCSGY